MEPEPSPNSDDLQKALEKRIGNLVPGGAREQVVRQVLHFVREEYGGPLPHPRHFEQFEAICPGAADRILRMAEEEQQAQIELATIQLNGEIADRARGMHYGFLSLIALVGGAVVCGVTGHDVLAGAFLGAAALGTVARFVLGRNGGPPEGGNQKKT